MKKGEVKQMKSPYNIYCFRLLFKGNKSYFYRCAAHDKKSAYMKMITELLHDTTLLFYYNLTSVKLLHVIVNSDNDRRFIKGLNIAANKYYRFVHNFEYAAMQQFYYLNTYCKNSQWTDGGAYCLKYKKSCCMDNGIYCKDYTKGRELK